LRITTESLENRQLLLTVEVDEEQAQQAMRRAARQIAKQINIPGFRKGKAPYSLILQRYGEDTIRREAAESLAEEAYREALEQENIESYAPGVLEEVTLSPISFKFTIPLHPTVDLGDYRSYRLKPRKARIYKKEVQQALEQLREQNAILELVERPAELGDGVVIDLLGQTAEGVQFLKGEDVHLLLDAESTSPAPGFAEAIVGMEAGEERTFTLILPDDYPQEELRGQEGEFSVKMKEVYDSVLPELDDDLARTVGNFDSLRELEQHIKEQLRQAAQQQVDEEYTAQVLQDLLEQAQVEYPPVMLEQELDELVKEFELAIRRQAHLPLEDYLRIQGKDMDELRRELEPQAAARLKRALVLGEVIVQEGLDVDEEEINAQIEEISASWGDQADRVRISLHSEENRQTLRSRLLANKAIQRLVAIAKGEVQEATPSEGQEREADADVSEEQEAESN